MIDAAHLPARKLIVTDFTCVRGERMLFSGLNFALSSGKAILLRGPNGIGKTSLLLTLAGFLHSAPGEIAIEGRDPEARPGEDMHFIGHQSAIKPGLSVIENLEFWIALYGGEPKLLGPALEEAGLDHAASLDAGLLSAGQTRRLALARLIIAPRPIWLLDEPTAALDSAGEKWVGALIDAHLDNGGLLVAATHLDLPVTNIKRLKTIRLGETGGKK